MTRRRRLLAWLAVRLIKVWIASLRYQRHGPPFEGPGLIAFWHGDQLPLFRARPSGDVVAPVSLSQDGRLQARILHGLGVAEVPGSSSRGGLGAARGLLRALKRGAVALFAVDGPRGPRGDVKPGVVYLAQRAGVPIWPVAVAVRRGRRLTRSWDKYLLPLPFTRVLVWVGAPVRIEANTDLEAARLLLSQALDVAGQAAQKALTK